MSEVESIADLQNVKNYVLEYFSHCLSPIGIIMWCPDKRTFRHLTILEAKSLIRKDKCKGPITFDLQHWFFQEEDKIYEIGCDPIKPIIYQEQEWNYVNLFPGFLYQNVQKFSEYDKEKRDAVHLILEHIQKVWCSEKLEKYEYVLK